MYNIWNMLGLDYAYKISINFRVSCALLASDARENFKIITLTRIAVPRRRRCDAAATDVPERRQYNIKKNNLGGYTGDRYYICRAGTEGTAAI